jgi:hypothetical protein
MSNPVELVGITQRLNSLKNPGEDVVGYAPVSETSEGFYLLVLRLYPHPEDEGVDVLNFRYAYLTRGDGSDGWLENGVNIRCEGDPARLLVGLGRLFDETGRNLHDGEMVKKDVRPRTDRTED